MNVNRTLASLGFPMARFGFTQSVKQFQTGWNLGPALKVDGLVGPLTLHALELSAAKGLISPHFKWAEFACKCHGQYPDCRLVWPSRGLLVGLERLRTAFYSGGLSVVSGCRCVRWNHRQGGAPESQHVIGRGADVPPVVAHSRVSALHVFGGVGYSKRSGKVVHVDVRPGSGIAFVDGP